MTEEQIQTIEALIDLLSADPTLTIGKAICIAYRDPSISGSQLGYSRDVDLHARLKVLLARTSYKPCKISVTRP